MNILFPCPKCGNSFVAASFCGLEKVFGDFAAYRHFQSFEITAINCACDFTETEFKHLAESVLKRKPEPAITGTIH